MSKLRCVARGSSTVNEAFSNLDDSLVQFVLIKFPVGSGTFKRNKFVYVHFVGSKCGVVKRGKWNAELPNVLKEFRNPAAGIEEMSKEELNFDTLVTKLKKAFVSDDGSFSLDKIREEYNKRLEEEKKLMQDDAQGEEPTSPIRQRKLATDLNLKSEQILKAVHEDLSPFNWCTFEANPKEPVLHQAGSNGVFELLEHLPANKVLFGVLRMAFGTGRFRRTKRIFFHWTGDECGAVTKGKANAMAGDLQKMLGPVNADTKLNGAEDASLAAVLAKVEKVFVVDNINLPPSEQKKGLTQEDYVAALQEEQKANSSFYGEPEDVEPSSPSKKPTDFPVDETVKLIHQESGGLVWGVFQFA